jgi:hypothetical protein
MSGFTPDHLPTAAELNALFSGIDPQAFTASGTWNKHANARWCWISGVACGGGGGGVDGVATSGYGACAGGGGSGEYCELWVPASSLTDQVTVTIGAAGTGGAAGANNGAAGGDCSFGAYLTLVGGGGGQGKQASTTNRVNGGAAGAGGAGTATSGVYVRHAGEIGGYGLYSSNVEWGISGGGGSTPWGTGGPSVMSDTGIGYAGASGNGYGSGGSGAASRVNNATDYAGGDGKVGRFVIVTFY